MASLDLSDLIFILRLTGFYYDFSGFKAERVLVALQIFRIFFFICSAIATVCSMIYGAVLSEVSSVEVFFAFISTVMTLKLIFMYTMRFETERVIRMIVDIREKFQSGTDDEFQQNTKVPWKLVHIYAFAYTMFNIFYVFLPTVIDLIVWAIYKTPYPIRLPMAMDSFIQQRHARDWKYFLVTITTITWTCVGTYSHMGMDILLNIICAYYASLVKTYCNHLKLDSNAPPEKIIAAIKQHAAHHQALHNLSLKMIKLFGYPYAVQNVVGSMCVCSLLYALTSRTSTSSVLFFALIFTMLLLLANLVCAAYAGQYATNQTALIFDSLYDLPWYELRPEERKYFITMICAAREPFTIHYHGRSPLDLSNFMSILNTAYSYFMFIKSAM
ncbi:Odorant receptor [Nesidiocoris tenuis]|uniref:Odorant receptor n=1 Tax=Nesidiocoris tenuis TaxID=355587 RepID=A0ABN7A6U9_9HEMI|nr:Odorant receptor [Nesidiocoris tenuis]